MLELVFSNLGILLLMHLLISTSSRLINKEKMNNYVNSLMHVIIISAATISMFYFSISSQGFLFDFRVVPLVFIAVFEGWKKAIPILIMTSLWRYNMGGEFVNLEILYSMVLPTFISIPFHPISEKRRNIKLFTLITMVWTISDLSIFGIVEGINHHIHIEMIILRYLSILFAASIMYFFSNSELKQEELVKTLECLSQRDALTGLYNMKKFEKKVQEIKAAGKNAFVAMVDIDHFKRVNDTYGHQVGDTVIQEVSQVFKKYCGNHLVLARYGGDEYIFCISLDTLDEVKILLECIRMEISCMEYPVKDLLTPLRISISIGVAPVDSFELLNEAIEQADRQLYNSKKQGRNQICC